jgi:hypothetical protein
MRFTSEHHYPVSPQRVAELFLDQNFSLAAARAAGAVRPQADVAVEASGEFTLTSRSVNPAADLPAQLRALLPQGLEIRQAQVWGPAAADGARVATLAGEIVGAPVQFTGQAQLDPAPGGCRLAFDILVKAQLPLVGPAIERAAMPQIEAYAAAQDSLARQWLGLGD